MWHHRRARIDNIRLRVLHPNIQEHQTVDILRGLPEGSRLSPIFVADLIHELQTKFPHAVTNLAPGLQHNGTTQNWIGGLLYVDNLALMSTCPCELQAMLHVCQEWSVRNHMQLNTQKTKVMAFLETPSPCSYLITEVLQFEYLGLISTPNLPCTLQLPKPFDTPHSASP